MAKKAFKLVKDTVNHFFDDGCTSMAASLAYYTLFSLPPLLFLLLTALTWGFGIFYEDAPARATALIQQQVSQLIGVSTAQSEIHKIMGEAHAITGGVWKTILGIVGVMIGATGVVAAMQETLNRIWSVRPDPDRSGILVVLMKRLLSLAMILGLGFLMLVSFTVSTVLSVLVDKFAMASWLGTVINLVLLWGVLILLFAAIYRFMPDARIDWRDTWLGAAVTAALFVIGQFLLNLFLRFGVPSTGFATAAASLLILLTWVYYTSLVILFGAEFTRTWATTFGGKIRPEKGAVRVEEKFVRDEPT